MKNVDEILKFLKVRIEEVKSDKKYCFSDEDAIMYQGIENELVYFEKWIKENES